MNPQEQKQLKIMYLQLSAYYGRQIQDFVFDMYVQDLSDLSLEQVKNGMDSYRRNPKNRSMPLPGDIRASSDPSSDPDANARESASRIVAAVSKYGYNNPTEAEKFIGELGWHVVKRYGGWMYICENLGVTLDLTTFTAHARDLAKSTLVRGPEGITNAPQIPSHNAKLTSLTGGNDLNKALERK